MYVSTRVRLILFDLRQDPIELTRGYLAAAKFTNAGWIDLERGTTVWTVKVGACFVCLSVLIANKRPVLTPFS